MMNTKIFTDTTEDIAAAGNLLAAGGLVAFPTETVYGLGANALDAEAVSKVYAAKGRPSDNPMIVHISLKCDLEKLTPEITAQMRALADAFWPGPMTMIVPRLPVIPDTTTGGLDTVGIRMPDHPVALSLISAAGCPIAAPSANLSGKPSPTTARDVIEDLDGRVDAIIQSTDCQVGIESTVIDLTGAVPMILRPGILTKEEFEKVLGIPVRVDPTLNQRPDAINAGALKPKAPGMKYKHYAPKAEMLVFEGSEEAVRRAIAAEAQRQEAAGNRVCILRFDGDKPAEAAHQFFARLRQADREKADLILAAALPEEGVGFSVMNRMLKSAGYHIRKVNEMKIAIASDHGGFALKEVVKKHLIERGYEVVDLGTNSDASVDYPVYGKACGEAVTGGKADLGVVVCGTGIGISIAANKVKGVRCGLCTSVEMARLTRQHNNANVLALGGRTTAQELAVEIVDAWLDTEFEGGRHERRTAMLDDM